MKSRGMGCDYMKPNLYKEGSGIVGKQVEEKRGAAITKEVRSVANSGGKLAGPHLKEKYEY